MNTKMMTVQQVADFLHYHPNHVRRLIRQGSIRAFKISQRKTLVSEDEVNRFLKDGV